MGEIKMNAEQFSKMSEEELEQAFSKMSKEEITKAMIEQQEFNKHDVEEQDKVQKAKGTNFKVIAWIHPNSGDDYQVDIYYASKPTEQDIQHALKKSCVKEDYQVVEL